MYEGPANAGYVSTWHDACEETREMALAYDQIRAAIGHDVELVQFLHAKAVQCNLSNDKATPLDVCANIETRIFQDAIEYRWKIESNYPRTDIAVITLHTVMGWPANRTHVMELLDAMLVKATAVDGVTGEKGLAAYASYTIESVALLLGMYARLDHQFLPEIFCRHPRLRDMFRFHIDTWVFQRYYPQVGDTGEFAVPQMHYVALPFSKNQWLDSEGLFCLGPSTYTFLWQLYELTGDITFIQILYHENLDSVTGLPFDIFSPDSSGFAAKVATIIAQEGGIPRLVSRNFEEWHLALMRTGKSTNEMAVWLAYDCGGRHSHCDGLNLGLFAKGLDLMPDFGYPPVHQGGWSGTKFNWYLSTPAHNTVTVDGRNQSPAAAVSTLWADGKHIHAIRVSAPDLIRYDQASKHPLQYERTLIMLDMTDSGSYLIDIFRVCGGHEHARFMHSHYSTLSTQDLKLVDSASLDYTPLMRNYRSDPVPPTGWSADWKIQDQLHLLPAHNDIHLRYIDLSHNVEGNCSGIKAGFQ